MFRNLGLIGRLLPYLRRRKASAAGVVALAVATAVLALAAPWPMAFLIDSILGDKPFPDWLAALGEAGAKSQILAAVGFGVGLVLVTSAVSVLKQWLETRLELSMVLDFRSDLFAHIQRLPWTYHDQGSAGRYIYQTNYIAHEAGSVVTGLLPMAESVLTLIGMFAITYRLGADLALAGLVVLPFLVVSTIYYGRRIEPELLKVRELEGDSMAIVHEKLSIIKVVNSFVRERYEHARFRQQAKLGLEQRVKVTVRQTLYSLGVALILTLGNALVLYLGAQAVLAGRLSVGELLVVIAYLAAVYQPLQAISSTLASLQQQLLQLKVVFDVFDTPIEIASRPGATPLATVGGRIEFRGVSFTYPGRGSTLRDIDLVIEPGTRVALVGATGAGKSTMAALVPRYYDVDAGTVTIDGVDVRDLPAEWLRNQISVVMQDATLFADTIAANIYYGRLHAPWADLIQAAKDAGAHDFIEALPDGYATRIGERGARLSGGERQRIAIARAFLKDAPILILDEPTAAVDARTEAGIVEALDRLSAGRTTIVIAHRLSTIRSADKIAVLDGGRIVETGTHDELLARGGSYAELVAAQAGTRPAAAGLPDAAAPADGDPDSSPPEGADPGPSNQEPGNQEHRDLSRSGAGHSGAAPAAPAVRWMAPVPTPRAGSSWPAPAGRPRIVVLGMMTKMPVPGVVWQTMHYLAGFEACGCETFYVEAHARTPSMLMRSEHDDPDRLAAAFIDTQMRRFGLAGRWAYQSVDTTTVYGMSRQALENLYRSADLIINLHGGTVPAEPFADTGRLIYLETDPVQLQTELADGNQETEAFLAPHAMFFTFGENIGQPSCPLPAPAGRTFHPTRQPVVLDWWAGRDPGRGRALTTIGNWRQQWRDVDLAGERYTWSKHTEWEKIIDLPRRTSYPLELALASYEPRDVVRLRELGWHVTRAEDLSSGIDAYRRYVTSSTGELTVAKDQNVRLQTGWFSDRSATYLAAGRPVITQDTGFGYQLPTGEGLLAFTDLDSAAAAIDAVLTDPRRHRQAAEAIAADYFDATKVLGALLATCGVATRPRAVPVRRPDAFAPGLSLQVAGKHPTVLADATLDLLAGTPALTAGEPDPALGAPVRASVVVITFNHLEVTRLCLESLLVNTNLDGVEIIVIDNNSSDATPNYLTHLARDHQQLSVHLLETNIGFASAVNRGLAEARGEILVVLNNDVVVPPMWLPVLEAHLADPTVGMVGPVSPGAPNEAKITQTFTTYDELCDVADRRRRTHEGKSEPVGMLAMFCVAMRRDVYETVGPLDQQFEIGFFEDDDYSARITAAGFELRCAHDCLVHHFGETSFGDLVAGGERARLFSANKARFETKWGRPWQPHQTPDPDGYQSVISDLCQAAAAHTRPGARIAVASKGDERLLAIPGRDARHLPAGPGGGYAGHPPADTAAVMAELDGVDALIVPYFSQWWFDTYPGLRARVEAAFPHRSDSPAGSLHLREPKGTP